MGDGTRFKVGLKGNQGENRNTCWVSPYLETYPYVQILLHWLTLKHMPEISRILANKDFGRLLLVDTAFCGKAAEQKHAKGFHQKLGVEWGLLEVVRTSVSNMPGTTFFGWVV